MCESSVEMGPRRFWVAQAARAVRVELTVWTWVAREVVVWKCVVVVVMVVVWTKVAVLKGEGEGTVRVEVRMVRVVVVRVDGVGAMKEGGMEVGA